MWAWHLEGSDRLPARLRRQIERTPDRLWLSPVSIWEAAMLHARGALPTDDLQGWLAAADDALPLRDAAFNRDVGRMVTTVTMPHRDPADRFLAATALVYNLTLMTVDERLTAIEWLPTKSA